MVKKIKADALASEVMKELDDYSSLTTEVMKKAVRNAGSSKTAYCTCRGDWNPPA